MSLFSIIYVLLYSRLLSDLEALDRYLTDAGFPEIFNSQATPSPTPPPIMDKAFMYEMDNGEDSDIVGLALGNHFHSSFFYTQSKEYRRRKF